MAATKKSPGKSVAKEAATGDSLSRVSIKAPNFEVANLNLVGLTPYVQNAWGSKADKMMKVQEAGSGAKRKGSAKAARDFEADIVDATYRMADGRYGIPAGAFRHALVRACSLLDMHMTTAKMVLEVLADGEDERSGTPLVELIGPEPVGFIATVRNKTGVADLRARPRWKDWSCVLRVRYDADVFTQSDVANLVMRAGIQVGIGEGRPFSKQGVGQGWGTFSIAQ